MKRQTFIEYAKVILVSFAVFFITALFSFIEHTFNGEENIHLTTSVNTESMTSTIVIDAGHGGQDGGAVGISGTLEKDINLELSKELESMLNLVGVIPVMTRTDDTMLYKEGQESRKKFYDVKNRVEAVNNCINPVLISIHQNKFPIEKYRGLQVYYSDNNSLSKDLAQRIQQKTAEYLQPDNKRQIKAAGRNIYLMHNLDCPAVLVECGFLSNTEEEKQLNETQYQRKIAFIIFSSIMDYISNDL